MSETVNQLKSTKKDESTSQAKNQIERNRKPSISVNKEQQNAKVEKWLASSNLKRDQKLERSNTQKQQKINTDKDALLLNRSASKPENKSLLENKEIHNTSTNKDIVIESKIKVERWLSSSNLEKEPIVQRTRIKSTQDTIHNNSMLLPEFAQNNNKTRYNRSSSQLDKNRSINNLNKESSVSAQNLNASNFPRSQSQLEKNSSVVSLTKETSNSSSNINEINRNKYNENQKTLKELDSKYSSALVEVNEIKLKNSRKTHKRTPSNDKAVKEKRLSANLIKDVPVVVVEKIDSKENEIKTNIADTKNKPNKEDQTKNDKKNEVVKTDTQENETKEKQFFYGFSSKDTSQDYNNQIVKRQSTKNDKSDKLSQVKPEEKLAVKEIEQAKKTDVNEKKYEVEKKISVRKDVQQQLLNPNQLQSKAVSNENLAGRTVDAKGETIAHTADQLKIYATNKPVEDKINSINEETNKKSNILNQNDDKNVPNNAIQANQVDLIVEKLSDDNNHEKRQNLYSEVSEEASTNVSNVQKDMAKEIEKQSLTPEAVSNVTDRDSKELIKDAQVDEVEVKVKGFRQTLNSAKKQMLQNWLKDYRKIASKSQRVPKNHKAKYAKKNKDDIEAGESDKNELEKQSSRKPLARSKSKRRKRKAEKKRIAITVTLVVIGAILVLGVTIGLLLNFLVFNKKDTSTVNVCTNTCPQGFEPALVNNKCNCSDINECLSTMNTCNSIGMFCLNKIGSYTCNCTSGFKFNDNKTACLDINECETPNICDQEMGCKNTIGSYVCNCVTGFKWDSIQNSCVDINECYSANKTVLSNICGLNKQCINTIGSYTCACSLGFDSQIVNNELICTDINECLLNSSLYQCPYSYTCLNTAGSYQCCKSNGANNANICPSCGLQYFSPSLRIIGGQDSQPHAWPWFVSIGISYQYTFFSTLLQADVIQWLNRSHICGGALISNRYILTAAHCVSPLSFFDKNEIYITPNEFNPTLESVFTVYIGVQDQQIDKNNPDNLYKIEKIFIHEQFDHITFLNDIALLRLSKPVEKTVNSDWICMTQTYANDFNPLKVYAVGFGVTSPSSNDMPNILKQVSLSVYPFSNCSLVQSTLDSKSQICAGDLTGQKDTCSGDSGSPLMYNYNGIWFLIGIVSYGKGCALANYAGIYTNVTYYASWIAAKIF